MRPLVTFMIATFLLLPIPAFATIQTVTATIHQPFGGSQSPDDARTASIARAKREALERAGTYIESLYAPPPAYAGLKNCKWIMELASLLAYR